LTGEVAATNTVLWSFAGDGGLAPQLPVSAGPIAYAASTGGHLYALKAATGKVLATETLAAGVNAPLAMGDGVLVVPTTAGIEVFG
jgi:outer membrane protein assembly factor BamB